MAKHSHLVLDLCCGDVKGLALPAEVSGGGGGIDEAAHEALDTLVHDIAETSWDELVRTFPPPNIETPVGRIQKVIVWSSPAKTLKIRETDITRSANHPYLIKQVDTIQYDALGVEKYRIQEVMNRTGFRLDSVTRTRI